jgi:CRP/FNR family transcriptional regulator
MKNTLAECGNCDSCCFGKICKDYLFDKPVPQLVQSLERKKCHKKGDNIFSRNDEVTHLLALRRGAIKLYDAAGNIQNLFTSGQLINGDALHNGRYHYDAIAATDTEICMLETRRLYDLSLITTDFLNYTLELLSRAVYENQRLISVLTRGEAAGRICAFISLLSQKLEENTFPHQRFTLPVTLKEMATLLAISPSTQNRIITELCQQDIIATEKKEIIIINKELLWQRCNFNHFPL